MRKKQRNTQNRYKNDNKPEERQASEINRLARDISSSIAKQRDQTTPLPSPFYSSAPAIKATEKVVYSRQLPPDDMFVGAYDLYGLIVPPYSPTQLYSIYESSSILSPHIGAYIQNIDGFDIAFKYIGPIGQKDTNEAKEDKKRLADFFRKANERQSFRTIRRAMRLDYEILGYGFMEITRSTDGEIACIYSIHAKHIRLANLVKETPQEITVYLPRNGKDKPITVRKKFRRYAQVLPGAAKNNIRWFKEYGDPRQLDAVTGKFEEEATVTSPASELIHFKIGEDTYGLPRWVGNILGVIGVRSADFINYDLFDSQGIPPLVVMVSGGILTQDSMDTIENLLKQAKGYQNFNRLLLLEAQAEGGIDDKIVPRVDLKPLNEARTDDAMFQKYIHSTEEKLRMDFRLPMIFVGRSSDYNRAVIELSRIIAEEQVFEPERNIEDEIYNNTIMQELESKFWAFKSGSPPLVTGEGLMRGFDSVSNAGVLTINQSLEIANRALDLDFEEIKEEWGNYPLTIVTRLLDRGFFADLQQLIDVLEGNASVTNSTTILPENPEADTDNLNADINKTLNTILNKAKDQLLTGKIKEKTNTNKVKVEHEE